MLIFTVKNKMTGDVFVGTTGNDLSTQWQKILDAAELDLDFPLYRQIRRYGDDQFLVEEWDWADNRRELNQLERDAIDTLGAQSLRGYKTAVNRPKVRRASRKVGNAKFLAMEKELTQMIFGDDDGGDNEPGLFDDVEIPTPKGRLIKADELEEEEAGASSAEQAAAKVKAQRAAKAKQAPKANPVPAAAKPAQTKAKSASPIAKPSTPAVEPASVKEAKPAAAEQPQAQAAITEAVEPSVAAAESETLETLEALRPAPEQEIRIPKARPWQKPKLELDDQDIDSFLADVMGLMEQNTQEPEAAVEANEAPVAAAAEAEEVAPKPRVLSAEELRQQRIQAAIEAQRIQLAERTQADLEQQRAALAAQLAEFNQRAAALQANPGCLH